MYFNFRMGPTTHQRLFNVMLRVVGIFWVFAGTLGYFNAFLEWLSPVERPDVVLLTGSMVLDTIVMSSLAVLGGVLVLTRKPFRPDLGDRLLSDALCRRFGIFPPAYCGTPPSPSEARRNWWTGDPLSSK